MAVSRSIGRFLRIFDEDGLKLGGLDRFLYVWYVDVFQGKFAHVGGVGLASLLQLPRCEDLPVRLRPM